MPSPGLVTMDDDGERIVETQGRDPLKAPALLVLRLHLGERFRTIGWRRQFQDGGECRAAVFRIQIDLAIHQSLVCEQRASQVQFALHLLTQAPLELLRQNFSQHKLLGEILRSHHDGPRSGATAAQRQSNQTGDSFRSSHPKPSSANKAIRAAGIAPARICALSTVEIPRKMKTPSPPAPIAAAMVAVPMVVTVAIRTPARIVRMASGSSTCHRTCRPVIPMATADSRTAASTPKIPASVLRIMGKSA